MQAVVLIITCPYSVQVLRLEPHCVISNRTGIPLQIMHYNPSNKLQPLGGKASGVQPSQGQQPSRTPPGLKGVVADPRQDWTSCMDVPAGAIRPMFCAFKHAVRGSIMKMINDHVRSTLKKTSWASVPLTCLGKSQHTLIIIEQSV